MEEVTVRTRLDRSLMTRVLMRGSVAAGLGIVLILIAAIELPAEQLVVWGIPILLISLGLIVVGLVPYRLLAKRRDNPDYLKVMADGVLYAQGGKPTLTIPYEALSRVHYLNDPPTYGVLINLKEHPTEKVKVHTRDYDVHTIRHKTLHKYQADLFLPFFPDTEFDELRRGLALAGYADDIPLD